MHEALRFVARFDPDPVTYELVREEASFDTKTLDRLRARGVEQTVDRTDVFTPVVARVQSRDGPYEYRMTGVGWDALDHLGQAALPTESRPGP